MTPTVALWVLVVLTVIGAVQMLRRVLTSFSEIGFTRKYLYKFRGFLHDLDAGGCDKAAFEWLSKRGNKMQRELGAQGIMAFYRPPYENYAIENYPMLVNTLSKLPTGRAHEHDLAVCDNMILRHLGDLEDYRSTVIGRAVNPLIWLTEGARTLITLPLWLARESGLIRERTYAKAEGSYIIKLIAFVVPIASLAVAITVNWETLSNNITRWFAG